MGCCKDLMNFESEVNTIISIFGNIFGLSTRPANVRAQPIDDHSLQIYDMVLAKFLLYYYLGSVQFFKKIFSLTETNLKVILGMPILSFSNTNINFAVKKLT